MRQGRMMKVGVKREIDPPERARQAILRFRQRQHGQAGHAQNERDDVDRRACVGENHGSGAPISATTVAVPTANRRAVKVMPRVDASSPASLYCGTKRTSDEGKPIQDRVPAMTAMTHTHTKMPNSSGPIQRAMRTWLTYAMKADMMRMEKAASAMRCEAALSSRPETIASATSSALSTWVPQRVRTNVGTNGAASLGRHEGHGKSRRRGAEGAVAARLGAIRLRLLRNAPGRAYRFRQG